MKVKCSECGTSLAPQVLESGGGWYVGYWCPNCGPYDRISGYYPTREDAETVLQAMTNY